MQEKSFLFRLVGQKYWQVIKDKKTDSVRCSECNPEHTMTDVNKVRLVLYYD